jgi:hypothetical protein
MITRLHTAHQTIQRHTGKLLLAGLLAVAGHNWRLWQHDKALARKLHATQPAQPKLSRAARVTASTRICNRLGRSAIPTSS